MSRSVLYVFIAMLACGALLVACSDDKPTNPPSDGNTPPDVQLSSYAELVSQIAPPEFGGATLTPGSRADVDTGYGAWADGDWPLLGKVFGANEPMSLYRNISDLDRTIGMINVALEHPNATLDTTVEDQAVTAHTSVVGLEAEIQIPADCQTVLGIETADLDYLVGITVDQEPAMENSAAFTKTETEERVLMFFRNSRTEGQYTTTETNLVYAYRNLETDSLVIRASFCKDQGDGTKAMWVYDITTMGESDFAYRMSWYADDFGDTSAVACIVGGGNKDAEFALRYRQYRPADIAEPNPDDPYGNMTRTFGPNYADMGSELATGYAALTDPDLMFKLADFPTGVIENPME